VESLLQEKIRLLYLREQAERRRKYRMMESNPNECIYDVLRRPDTNTLPALNRLKAQTVRLHGDRLQTILNDNSDEERPDGEEPTIHHILKTKRRSAEQTICRLKDANGQLKAATSAVAQTLTFLRDNCHNRSRYLLHNDVAGVYMT
jgi:hypothetical protein